MDKWWKQSTFYEIYMPSFKDGNGDGIGDFQGITSKLDYLKELGIDGVWLTPFYPSPKVDNGYDISDYYEIDSDYGTMEDFEIFIQEAHQRGIRVIADLVLNHTSSEHPWFKESKSSKNHSKRDWYIWKDKPNNWESFFGGSAWEYDKATEQYYYHAFAPEQVDLNWHNPEVKKAMFNVIRFWLKKGIDGFRLDVINFLKINDSFLDNPFDEKKQEQIHLNDKDQEGILFLIEEISKIVHQYPDKFLVGEVGSEDLDLLKQYSGPHKLDVVFNFNIGSIEKFDADQLFQQLLATEETYEDSQIATLFFSSHDMSRHISRFGNREDRAKLVATLMLTAKGIPFIYNGDEIGMKDWLTDDIKKMKDIQGITAYKLALKAGKSQDEALMIANEKSRDKSRTPMQWNDDSYAGFSTSEPWISVPAESHLTIIEAQQDDPSSMLSFYKELLKLRKERVALHAGNYEYLCYKDGMITFAKTKLSEKIVVVLNFSEEPKLIELESDIQILLLTNQNVIKEENTLTLLANEAIIYKEDTEICT
ncbi:MAG: alpha-glucosidase [Niallia sp.]